MKSSIRFLTAFLTAAGLMAIVACQPEIMKQMNAPDVESPIPADVQYEAAHILANYYERRLGVEAEVAPVARYQEHNSMGQAISRNAYVVRIVDWDGTDVNDMVSFEAIYPHDTHRVLHQVIIKDSDAMRTRGINNPLPDSPVHVASYKNTVVGQLYFRSPDE
jgi:hypothetical protein